MKAGLYARVSRAEQAEGYSIDEQIKAMRKFCKERGWTVIREFIEPGASGTIKNRPSLKQALEAFQAGEIEVLLTHRLDRFFRNLRLQLETLGQLAEWEVGYLSVTEQIDYSTPQGKFTMSMMGAINEYFSANLSRETKKGKQGRAMDGRSNASWNPAGYKKVDGQHVIDEKVAPAVQRAFELYATGRYGDRQVGNILNREGYPVPQPHRAGRWTRDNVRVMLTNRFYLGEIRHKEQWLPGTHKPLIEEELWNQARQVRLVRAGGYSRAHKYDNQWLLRGLVWCNNCGSKVYSDGKGKANRYGYYVCSSPQFGIVCDRRLPAAGSAFYRRGPRPLPAS